MTPVVVGFGPSGAGKTTYARRLENGGMTRLSFDVEMWRRNISTGVLRPQDRADIEAILKERLLVLVAEERDVVLDFSFWSRQMREEWRQWLRPTGVIPETIYLDTDRDTVLQRMRERRGTHSDDYALDEQAVARYFDPFEAPTPDEGPLTVIR